MTMDKPIHVLVVEDSPSAQLLIVHLLEADPRLKVVATAYNGEEALERVKKVSLDVIVMDIHLPGMDGYETTRRIMESHPVPIVVCSASISPGEAVVTFRTLEAGALALVAKPVGPAHPDHQSLAQKLRETVKVMSEVKVIRRWPKGRRSGGQVSIPGEPRAPTPPVAPPIRVIAIGASTGGPPVLQTILTRLPKDFPAPILIVQHIAAGFLGGLTEWLRQTTGFPVHIGTHQTLPQPGHAYVAPDNFHMEFGPGGRILLSGDAPENGVRPAVSRLFRSVAETCGAGAVGVLLTGMGRDGSSELHLLKDAGAVTVAQDAQSSVVHGMPGEAIKLGAATHVLPPKLISDLLIRIACRES